MQQRTLKEQCSLELGFHLQADGGIQQRNAMGQCKLSAYLSLARKRGACSNAMQRGSTAQCSGSPS